MERHRLVSKAAGGARRPGRPRSEAAHGAILDAAMSLLREVGYDTLAMDAIAARAGVGKATVYRRWASKELLVAEALERIIRAIRVPDTGTTQGDLLALMRDTLQLYQDPQTLALLSGLVAAMARSERIARALRSGLITARRDAMRQVLERGVQRGDLAQDVDVELALDLLSGPLFYRALLTGGRVDAKLTRGLVDVVLRGLAPPSRSPVPHPGGREP